ncbi:hypothetical protein BC830DRAFT_1083081 [Chytriomyces sp. MP71]|nr:hypothetical protein BC830DRAFT_1083081 [Chytriomyces sp. MP71]
MTQNMLLYMSSWKNREGTPCFYCGSAIVWKAGQDIQVSMNCLIFDGLAEGGYFVAEQEAVSSCLLCQRLFNKLSKMQRISLINIIYGNQNQLPLSLKEKIAKHGVSMSSHDSLQSFALYLSFLGFHIQGWRFLVIAIGKNVVSTRMVTVMFWCLKVVVHLNDAKFAIPAFHSKGQLHAYQTNIGNIYNVLILVICSYFEQFIEFQRRKLAVDDIDIN